MERIHLANSHAYQTVLLYHLKSLNNPQKNEKNLFYYRWRNNYSYCANSITSSRERDVSKILKEITNSPTRAENYKSIIDNKITGLSEKILCTLNEKKRNPLKIIVNAVVTVTNNPMIRRCCSFRRKYILLYHSM